MHTVSTTIATNEYPAGPHYTARDAGPNVEFWNAGELLFIVPAAAAGSQTARDALAAVYDAGRSSGRIAGRMDLKREIKRLLGIS